MIRFLIVDDDLKFTEKLQKILYSLFDNVIIDISDIYNDVLEYAVYFLDIEMPDRDGISIAQEIKNKHKGSIVVFSTQREDLIFNALDTLPLYIIRKSHLLDGLSIVSIPIKEKIEEDISSIIIQNEVKILTNTITHITKIRSDTMIYTTDDIYKTRISINAIYDQLPQVCFGIVRSSFIVNFKYVENTNKNYVVVQGHRLMFSRGRYKDFYKNYRLYKDVHK